jgi:hypothetical protein
MQQQNAWFKAYLIDCFSADVNGCLKYFFVTVSLLDSNFWNSVIIFIVMSWSIEIDSFSMYFDIVWMIKILYFSGHSIVFARYISFSLSFKIVLLHESIAVKISQ